MTIAMSTIRSRPFFSAGTRTSVREEDDTRAQKKTASEALAVRPSSRRRYAFKALERDLCCELQDARAERRRREAEGVGRVLKGELRRDAGGVRHRVVRVA